VSVTIHYSSEKKFLTVSRSDAQFQLEADVVLLQAVLFRDERPCTAFGFNDAVLKVRKKESETG
jgi:hypothetical protein